MLGCNCLHYLPMLALTLYASRVQTAPLDIAFVDVDHIDRLDLFDTIKSLDYALADKREMNRELALQLMKEQFKEDDLNMLQMHMLQINLMKILIILDMIILICILYAVESDETLLKKSLI